MDIQLIILSLFFLSFISVKMDIQLINNSIGLSYIPLLLGLFLFPIVVIFYSGHVKSRKTQPNLPPGNMGWPVIGETLAYLKHHQSFSLSPFAKDHIARYGKIYRSNLFGEPTIVSADPGLNRFVLQNEGRFFEASYPTSMERTLGKWSILLLKGEMHREMRSIMTNFLSISRLRFRMLQEVEHQALLILDSWKDGSRIAFWDESKKFTFNIVVKNMINVKMEESEKEKIRREYRKFVGGVVSIPYNIPGNPFWKALKARAVILEMIEKMLNERTKETTERDKETKEAEDIIGWCLREPTLTMEQMLNLALTLLFAGIETTGVAVSLSVFFLAECPKAFHQLRDEHLEIAKRKKERGDNKLSWEDYKQMEFTQCVINETLRLGNIAQSLTKKATQDVQYKGYDIPKGWQVLPAFSDVHLDSSLHNDPQRFNPWRWQDKSAKSSENFVPFGAGIRYCPGSELAKMEVSVFLHHLVLNYRWELAEHDEPLVVPFINFKKGLPIIVHKIRKQTIQN